MVPGRQAASQEQKLACTDCQVASQFVECAYIYSNDRDKQQTKCLVGNIMRKYHSKADTATPGLHCRCDPALSWV